MRRIRKILAFFLASQFLGLTVGAILVNAAQFYPEFQELNVAPGGESSSLLNPAIFLLYVLFGAVVMVLVLKFYKGELLFKLIEASTLFIAANVVFFVLFAWFGVPMDWVWAVLISTTITAAKFFKPELKNLAAIIASAGVGAVFGFSLDIVPAVVFVAGLSLYDFASVFLTGHMVYMAKELGKRNLAFSVAATEYEVSEETGKPERSTLELGTGDMVIPLMLAVSAYKIALNPFDSIAVIFGAMTGLFLVLWYVNAKRTFLPALPPISFCALLSLMVFRLFLGA